MTKLRIQFIPLNIALFVADVGNAVSKLSLRFGNWYIAKIRKDGTNEQESI